MHDFMYNYIHSKIVNLLNLCASSYSASLLFFCSCNRSYKDLVSYVSSGASIKIREHICDTFTIINK